MPDSTVVTERFQIHFGHQDGGQCDKLTVRTLDCVVEGGVPRIDISTWGDPGLQHCQFCREPLTRVASYSPLNPKA
ncbi:MAG: hypothetical protein WC851_04250 [Candidatus Shapirobacteria bacterium]|jgi:hypothetical protein